MDTFAKRRKNEEERLKALSPSEVDTHPKVQGVLLSDEIEHYVTHHRLIEPFNPDNLKAASYELTVSSTYFQGGEFFRGARDGKPIQQITIPSFDVVVLTTVETLCLPRYMIARWNIRVRHAYAGLLWVGAPQVDPGYRGHLPCPIYNLSDKPVTLNVGDPFAVMDFVKTTPFDSSKAKRYPFPSRVLVEEYGIREFRSALFHKAGEKLEEVDDSIRNLEGRFNTFTQLSLAIFALVIAIVVAASLRGEPVALGASVWGAVAVGISIAALLVAVFSYVQWRVGRTVPERYGTILASSARRAQQVLRRYWLTTVAVTLVISMGVGTLIWWVSDPYFRAVVENQFATKAELGERDGRIEAILDRLERVEAAVGTGADLDMIEEE